MRKSVSIRVLRDPKKGERCYSCKKPAHLIGWNYAPRKVKGKFSLLNMKKEYHPMCKNHFLEGFFGLWVYECKLCKKELSRRKWVEEERWSVFIPISQAITERSWCYRHHQRLYPIRCQRRGHIILSARMEVRKGELCFCGRSKDAVDWRVFESLEVEEQWSLRNSEGRMAR